jgi:hypothetical protein
MEKAAAVDNPEDCDMPTSYFTGSCLIPIIVGIFISKARKCP